MIGWWKKRRPGEDLVEAVHGRLVAASRAPELYGPGRLPDTLEGRFESLVLHVMLVLRRLRALPEPADAFAQELIDLVFAHLEVALREMGVGDFGVPKRMKKLAGAFYDRLRAYEPACESGDEARVGRAIAEHLPGESPAPDGVARYLLLNDRAFAGFDFDRIVSGPLFDVTPLAAAGEAAA